MQMTLPQILKKVRLDKGLSQENIAEEIKTDVTTYGRYERGETLIKFEQVAQIAAFYKMTLDEFYHYGDPDFKIEEPSFQYAKRPKVLVTIELDGLEHSFDTLVERLRKLNAAV